MTPASCEAVVALPAGVALHARPAGVLARTAMRFRARITLSAAGRKADAKSVLSVMALGARGGSTLHVRADGEDAAAALATLTAAIAALH